MSTKISLAVAWILVLLTLAAGFYYYPALPAHMASHWNLAGQADGTMSKLWSILLVPIIMIVIIGVFALIPRIDPLRNNIESFRPQYNLFVVALTLMLAVIQGATLAINLGVPLNIAAVVMPAIGALFFVIGMILPQTKRNWFVGIRTPWTVSSDIVWKKTHDAGGVVFKVLGVVGVLGVFAPAYVLPVFITILAVGVVGLVVYSYIAYREVERPSK